MIKFSTFFFQFLLHSKDLESDDAFALFFLQAIISALECQSRAVQYTRVKLLDEFLAQGAIFVGLILSCVGKACEN